MKDNLKPTVLITGGGRGIGRAVSVYLGSLGYPIAITYVRNQNAANETVKQITDAGGQSFCYQHDVRDISSINNLLNKIEKNLGLVGVLVFNAGLGIVMPTEKVDQPHWNEVIDTNLSSAFFMTQSVTPGMIEREYGRLIFMSSIAARVGGVISAPYAASKAGLEGLCHFFGANLIKHKISSNCIAPAFIDTDMIAAVNISNISAMPLGRLGYPSEVASVVELLINNPYINGQTLHVNAGRYMT